MARVRGAARAAAWPAAVATVLVLPLVSLMASPDRAGAAGQPYAAWNLVQAEHAASGSSSPAVGGFTSPYPFSTATPLLTSLSCPSAGYCFAVDRFGNVAYTTSASTTTATWSHLDIDGANPLVSISCASTSMCAAVDNLGNVLASSSPTSSWTNVSGADYTAGNASPSGKAFVFTSISCGGSSPYVCAATANQTVGGLTTGYLFVSTNPTVATSWPVPTSSSINASATDANPLEAVSCPTAYFCIAGDGVGSVLYNSTGGTFSSGGWIGPQAGGGAHLIDSISCAAATAGSICVMGDSNGNTITAISFSAGAGNPFPGSGTATTNPLAWTPVHVDGVNTLTSVSCAGGGASGVCDIGDNSGNYLYTSNGGTTWHAAVSLDGTNIIEGMSCPTAVSPVQCTAVDNIGKAFYTTAAPTGFVAYTPIVDGYTAGSVVDGVDSITVVACPSATLCVAGDDHGRILTSSTPSASTSSAWTSLGQIDTAVPNPITGISCATTTFCVAVDGSGNAFPTSSPTGGVSSWTANKVSIAGTTRLNAISCPATTLCVVTYQGGLAVSLNPSASGGGSWSTLSADVGNNIISISCPSTSFCAAADGVGNALVSSSPTAGAAGWTAYPTGDVNPFVSISCPSSSLCVAADSVGGIYYSASPASTPWTAVPGGGYLGGSDHPAALSAVSCVSSTLCLALGYDAVGGFSAGWESTNSGANWCEIGVGACGTAPFVQVDSVPATVDNNSLACVASSFCVAGDSAGDILSSAVGTLQVAVPNLPAGVVGRSYYPANPSGFPVSASGGIAPYFWQLTPALPSGLTYTQSGSILYISGIPTATGTTTFTVTVSDSSSPAQSASATFSLSVINGWTTPVNVDGARAFTTMQCVFPTVNVCIGADKGGFTVAGISGGLPLSVAGSWSPASNTGAANPVSGISCPASGQCFVSIGCPARLPITPPCPGSGSVYFNSTPNNWWAWTGVSSGSSNVAAISCPSSSLCVAASLAPSVQELWATTPTSPWPGPNATAFPAGFTPVSLSCPSTSLCIAGGQNGQIAWTTNPTGGAWTSATVDTAIAGDPTPNPNQVNSLTCVSTSSCFAVDNQGDVLTSTSPTGGSSAWQVSEVDLEPALSYGYPILSISCPTTSYCVAGDSVGDVLQSLNPSGGAGSWFAAPMDSPNALGAMACASVTLCVAGDSAGNILTSITQSTLSITTGSLNSASAGVSYSVQLAATGGDGNYSWSAQSNAPGLSLSSAGLLSGTPSTVGIYSIAVTVTDATLLPPNTASTTLQLTVNPPTFGITTTSVPAATVGVAYSANVNVIGGTTPYAWAIGTGSSLPPGMSLSTTTGLISGTPTASGSYSVVVNATDSANPAHSASVTLGITVSTTIPTSTTTTTPSPPALSVATSSLPTGNVGTFYSDILTASGGIPPYSWSPASGSSLPAGLGLSASGTISGTPTVAATTNVSVTVNDSSNPVRSATATLQLVVVCTSCTTSVPTGYWMVGGDGSVYNFGKVGFFGSASGIAGGAAGMAGIPGAKGYWIVSTAGQVHAFGDASATIGSASNVQSVIGMAATPDGGGYWIATATGNVVALGDAPSKGSKGGKPLNKPVVGIASTPDGGGYWLVASDGGVFSFGDAKFFGSMGGKPLNKPMVGIASTTDGKGYWMVASDGGIFTFGDAKFFGSMGGTPLVQPVVGIASTMDGKGYWMVASDGGIFTFGDAKFFGSMGGKPLAAPIVGMAGP